MRADHRTAEDLRLEETRARTANWQRWGPYLSERQWGTVREDYSGAGDSWRHFPHDHARSRAYRWGEDGLLGVADRQCRLCFALALWNERDPILKERLFGLTGLEGNHGEDVKECYYYLDSTPSHAFMKALYKYPQGEYPYARLLAENASRGKDQAELELLDTGIFDGDRYFDVGVDYAKAGPEDLLVEITVANRGPQAATLHLLPTLWFRNTWAWGRDGEGFVSRKPKLRRVAPDSVVAEHESLGRYRLQIGPAPDGSLPELLFTENETNAERLFGAASPGPYVKDAFHDRVIHGRTEAVDPRGVGTKAAAWYRLVVPARSQVRVRLRLCSGVDAPDLGGSFDQALSERRREADLFYGARMPPGATDDERLVIRQAYAGLLWSKQFYHYVVEQWLTGDPGQPLPPKGQAHGRNHDWTHLFNRDVLSMPDKWEYPWYAAWDLAFHMIPMARVDPEFAKAQLLLLLREWYMHPNGQIPAYELALGDVNPPVHAWAVWRVYKMSGQRGRRDRLFLERAFHKLLLNFTWWVNRKDPHGRHLFSGGFLGLDNIGVFDRSQALPTGGHLEQADGTAWMAFYCGTMLSIALELAGEDGAYEDVASKFFEHFLDIVDAMNSLGGTGLWDEEDGFYYDHLHVNGAEVAVKLRSMVGIIPLFTAEVLEQRTIAKLPGFGKRMQWFLTNRPDLARHIACMDRDAGEEKRLLAIPSRQRLVRVLRYVLDEREFLSPYGVRSLSRVYEDAPYRFLAGGSEYRVDYTPAESNSGLFGGNSNWRGPIWFPLNYLLVEALERYHHFYGDGLKVECPAGSGRTMNLQEVARELSKRLGSIFLPDEEGRRPVHGQDSRYTEDPAWRDLVLFYEYFHGETGRGAGASHQTGWTALAVRFLEDRAHRAAARAG